MNQTYDFTPSGYALSPDPPAPFSMDLSNTASWFSLQLWVGGQSYLLQPAPGSDLLFSSDSPLNLAGSAGAFGSSIALDGEGEVWLQASPGLVIQGPAAGPIAGVPEPPLYSLLLLSIIALAVIASWKKKAPHEEGEEAWNWGEKIDWCADLQADDDESSPFGFNETFESEPEGEEDNG